MPTYEATDRFRRQFAQLTPQEQETFLIAVRKFVHDLRVGRFRKGLRVKPLKRTPGEWAMTWADDGRAVFRFGPSKRPGDPHIVWERIGSHDILDGA